MEITSVKGFLDYYEKVRERTNRLLSIVQPEHLEFTYKSGKYTVADQIRHIATIERYMYGETISGRKSAYPGCGKDLADGYDTIIKYFNELHHQTIEIISQFSNEDLNKKCLTPANVQITIWKWLRAMVEHEIHHRGELYIYLNLLGVETPPLYGFSAEKVQEISITL